ncbi:MAG: WHG domain-containing protein [Actinomycetales bacterium]|nr:WHG domain-containing protein [Actinomycetales bacterium]
MSQASRDRYRHGDLRQALLEAGLDMAREGGPDAIVLREATRRAGVAPNAAYRHFADRSELVRAVSDRALAELAEGIEARFDAVPADADPVAHAHGLLRAVGEGYLDYAFREPGLFRAAFTVPADLDRAADPVRGSARGRTPLVLLGVALDAMVEAGALSAERRPGAELLAWSSVHGLACLALDGPLRALDPATVAATGERLIAMVVRGL